MHASHHATHRTHSDTRATSIVTHMGQAPPQVPYGYLGKWAHALRRQWRQGKGTRRPQSVQSAYIMRRHTHLPSKKGHDSETNMKSAKAESSTNKTDSRSASASLLAGETKRTWATKDAVGSENRSKRPVTLLTYARSRLCTQLSSPRVQRDARHSTEARASVRTPS